MKTTKLWLTTIATLLCSLTASAHDFEVDGIYYEITSSADLTVKVTYRGNYSNSYSNEYSGAVTIPSTATYNSKTYSVTSIGNLAFYGCRSLTAITIPEGVTSIGSKAFYNCSSLTSITIPEGVTNIGDYAFQYCSSLTSITIPEGVTNIGSSAFSDCSSLTSITIPEGVTRIGNCAFDNCTSLKELIIGDGSTTLSLGYNSHDSYTGEGLFYDCPLEEVYLGRNLGYSSGSSYGYSPFYNKTKLTTLAIGDNVTSIPSYLFSKNTSLAAITLPEGVTSIGNAAFHACSSLTAITIPEGVTSIGSSAFSDCSSLTSIDIPEGVTSIGDHAFYDCSSLTSITIPEGVTSIGDYAFYNCSSLYKVINYSNLSLSKGSSSNGYVAYYAKVVYKGSDLTTVDDFQFYTSDGIHALVNYIGNDAEIVLPDSYNGENYKIGNSAFSSCSSLTSITLPESVTSIGERAFLSCHSLTAITIPEGVTSIGSYAFDNCTSLKELIIGDGSTTLSLGYNYYYSNGTGQGLFYECPLEEVYLGRNLSYNSGRSYGYSPFYDKDALKKVTIGNEVTEIGQEFRGCDNIHSLVMGNGVLSIGSNAFSTPDKVIWLTNTPPSGYVNAKGSINYVANDQYTSLSNVKVYPYLSSMFEVDGVKYVPVSPSERTCHAIDCAYDSTATAINVSETASFKGVAMKVTEVMPYTFYGNDHIKEVSVSHLGNIGNYAFCDCDAIETVTLGDSIGFLGDKAFYQCSSLQEIAIPDSVKSVGSYCFSGCSAMKSAVVGDGLTNIKEYTFENCTSLADVTMGDGVTTISNYAFTGCSALTNVKLGCSVATINNYAFQNCSSLSEITLPQAVTKVGDHVFAGCNKLNDVVIADRTTALALGSNGSSPLFADCPLDSVYIGGKVTYSTTSSKGYSPFYRNTSLRTVVITDREEQIYDNEFYGCTNLQNVTIGNGVKSIGNYAFSGCSSLEGFSFGSNMETIGAEAFSDCTNLTTITSHAAVPPTCGAQALDDINKWSCTLRVPSGYAAAYQAADQWKEFFFVEDVVEVEKYVLTYVVDGEVYHTDTLVHKATIVLPEAPTKEGYTFSGWSEAPETMPAEDVTISGTFTVNKYLVTFKIGEEVIAEDSFEYGATIVAPEAPEREGHTFNGWGEVATVVPANDLIYEGSYSVNSYLLSYTIDGEAVQSDSIAYGTAITLPEAPTKEGYTFSGWSETPETMPANDVVISGTFTVNKYLVTFKIGDEVIAADSLEYGATIVAPEAPEREGHTFNGWGEVAETVPAGDVTYEGSYTVNIYKVYYYVGEELVHTAEVAYGEKIPEYIYEPTKEGDVLEGWTGEPYDTMPSHDVTYTANITNGIEQLTNAKGQLTIYDLNGRKIEVEDLRELLRGIYIVNGHRVLLGD